MPDELELLDQTVPGPDPTHSWNPWYVIYARSFGREPLEQLTVDKRTYRPMMAGFDVWVDERLSEFLAANEIVSTVQTRKSYLVMHGDAFGKWLADWTAPVPTDG